MLSDTFVNNIKQLSLCSDVHNLIWRAQACRYILKCYFFLQWKTNLIALSRSALGQTLMVNQLVDMEWKFGGIVSSTSSNITYDILQICF